MATRNQRSQIMIKSDFQHRLIFSTLLIALIALNGILLAAGWLDSRFGDSVVVVDVFRLSVAVLEVLTVIVVYFVSRKISFHIAGPVYALERTLRQMSEGNLTQRLKLRKGDQFLEAAEVINEALETYQAKLLEVQDSLENNETISPEQKKELQDKLSWFVTRAEA